MKTFETVDDFWQEYFSSPQTSHSFDAWVVANITHTPDEQYAEDRRSGQDTLGFQPTLLTLANPHELRSESAVIKHLTSAQVTQLKNHLRQRFLTQFPGRFGLFDAQKHLADAIYDNWETFATEWLQQGNDFRLPLNLPLLLDHVSNVEFWAWQQRGFNPVGNQRLILTIFQPRTQKFAEVFINNVPDAELERIRRLLSAQITLRGEEILYAA